MALCVIVLGATAFLPILGVRFNWLPIHEVAGVLLVLLIIYHLYRVFRIHGVRAMIPQTDDLREGYGAIVGREPEGLKPAKYDALQKSFHWTAAAVVLGNAISGLLMLARVDTVFWNRNPSILPDAAWGVVYAIHGLSAMLILFLVIVHIYFGLIPQHRALLVAMITGQGPELARKGRRDD